MVHERLGGRRSIRLPEYDYSQDGAYFVTICTQNKEHLFGEIASGKMILNDAGRMIDMWWQELPRHFVPVQIDQYVIMPNHLHGVIVIVGVDRWRLSHKFWLIGIDGAINMVVNWRKRDDISSRGC